MTTIAPARASKQQAESHPLSRGIRAFSDYRREVARARAKFAENAFATRILSPGMSAARLELFLIQYSSLGVAMTRPVEGWILRAGKACLAMGMTDLGAALVRHSKHEAGHDELMVRDTHALVQRRHDRGLPLLSADALIARRPGPAARAYIELHEHIIAGPAPWAQIAVEYEIERLAVIYGPSWVKQCKQILGNDILSYLSFVVEHTKLDVGHTHFNEQQLTRFLDEYPDNSAILARAGSAALQAYSDFMDECFERVEAEAAATRDPV